MGPLAGGTGDVLVGLRGFCQDCREAGGSLGFGVDQSAGGWWLFLLWVGSWMAKNSPFRVVG